MKIKKIVIKIVAILLITILFVMTIIFNESFAKVLSLNLGGLRVHISNDENIDGIIGDGVYIISCSANNNFVLDVAGPSTDNTAKLNIWQRTEAPNQNFI